MRILVTNDDGIDSPGLWALAGAMSRVGQTLLVAPDAQRSGAGTSVSMHSGMRMAEVPSPVDGVRAYTLGGTPTDCVILGLWQLAQGEIDLIASGINLGGNMGTDILYSGTVMATLQGYYRQIPSMAVSLAMRQEEPEAAFEVASRLAELLALNMRDGMAPDGAILNVNVPSVAPESVKGIAVTRAASRSYVRLVASQEDTVLRRSWSTENAARLGIDEGTDMWAVYAGWISVTPLRPSVTDHSSIALLNQHTAALEAELLGKTLGSAG
ncbi:MAG: 5'/3'-nucleotidase SurE [Chloroflexota bacterium]